MSPSTEQRENRECARETKFLVHREDAEKIRAWARAKLVPDPNAAGEDGDSYQITSIYFDTPKFDVYHRRNSYGRSKFRIRRYGSNLFAFLERKLKTHGLVSKRRSMIPLPELERLGSPATQARWIGSWYERRLLLRNLSPVCQIAYRRNARVAMTPNGPIRLTLDENIRAVPVQGFSFVQDDGAALLLKEQIILELKYRMQMPTLFEELIQNFGLSSEAVSKYRLGAAALGLVPAKAETSNAVKGPAHAVAAA